MLGSELIGCFRPMPDDVRMLLKLVQSEGPYAKVRSDMRIAFLRDFDSRAERLAGTREILDRLAKIAEKQAA